jgi:hypothetical protein
METFQITLDTKHTIWYRTKAEINANSLQEAKEIAKELYLDSEIDEVEGAYTEAIYETAELMSVADNGDEPTEELFVDGDLVLTNLSEEDTSDFDYDDDPSMDHLRDEERNFIDQEREREQNND